MKRKKSLQQKKREKQIRNTVAYFNKKIDNLKKQGFEADTLPDKIDFNTVYSGDGRKDKKLLRELKLFTARGGENVHASEYGYITNYEYNRLKNKEVNKGDRILYEYNKKVRELARSQPELAKYRPKEIEYNSLKGLNKSDYMLEINSLKRFLDKNSEDIITTAGGGKITKYQVDEWERALKNINKGRRARKKWVEQLDLLNNTEVIGKVKVSKLVEKTYKNSFNNSKNDRYVELRDKKLNLDKMTQLDMEFFNQSIEKQGAKDYWDKTDRKWINNYITSMYDNLGMTQDTKKLANMIVAAFEKDKTRVLKFMYSQIDFGEVRYFYSLEGLADDNPYFSILVDAWERELNDKIEKYDDKKANYLDY